VNALVELGDFLLEGFKVRLWVGAPGSTRAEDQPGSREDDCP
jgi:hypothetical protein